VTEISHFLDIQKEEFEDLQNLLLNAVASLAPSQGASGEMEEISDYQKAVPEPPQEDGEDVVPADRVPSETFTTDIKSTENVAPADSVPSETFTIDTKSTENVVPADCVPFETFTTDIKSIENVAPADCVPSETLTTAIKSTEASETTNESEKIAGSTSNV
jgi:hypothetical protein